MVSGPVFMTKKMRWKKADPKEPVEDETDSTEAKDLKMSHCLIPVMEHEENLSEEEKKKRVEIRFSHRYVQDLYRFYTLSGMRGTH